MRALAVPALALVLAALPAHATLPVGDPRCGLPATSAPDRNALAGNGYVRIAPDGTTSWLLPDTYLAEWTADGSRVAYWTRPPQQGLPNVLCVANGDGSRARHVFTGLAWGGLAWSPDGASLATAGVNGVDVRTPAGTVTAVLDTGYATALAWAGDRVAYLLGSDIDGRLVTAHGDGSGRAELGYGVWTFALAPDATRVAYAAGSGLEIAAADGTGAVHVGDDTAYSPAWSPDSATLAYGGNVAGHTVPAAGSPATRVTTGETDRAGWTSATDPWFALSDGTHRWVETGGTRLATAAGAYGVTVARRTADGSYVLHLAWLQGQPLPRVG
jgi:hypothetical protein